ncbi:MAG: hypothetical protein GY833_16615 [Aestuariibacter sp.]|nr:hypothetical protein [Aestuariibacter sp.]
MTGFRQGDNTLHIPKFGGEIWYVNAGTGSDTNSGKFPDQAFATIGVGITAMSDGDALNIKAGTYTETGLTLSNDYAEMWCEIGVIIDPASGTALTVSGDACKVTGHLKVTPNAAVGVLVSGAECRIEGVKIVSGTSCYQTTGAGTVFDNCAAGFPTSIGFDIQGTQTRLYSCSTAGNASTIGYKVNNSVDTGVISDCTSVGHADAGYYIDTGSSGWTIVDCSSGAGDGRWVDVDDTNAWAGFKYDDAVSHTVTFGGGGPDNENLFRIYGTVLITALHGHVDTVLAGDVGDIYLELDDGTNQIDVTDSPGPDASSLPVESYIHKIDDATVELDLMNASQVRFYEDSTKFGRDPNFQVTAKAATATYLRLVWAGNAASGAIHWHCHWEPLTEDGFMDSV